jgi:hypothetical protein
MPSVQGQRPRRSPKARATGPPQPGRRIGAVALPVHVKAIFQGRFQCDEGRLWLATYLARTFGAWHLDRQRARANVAEGRWPACPWQAQVQGDDKQLPWLSRRAAPSRTQVDRRGAKAGLGCRHRRCVDAGRMAHSRDCRRLDQPSNGRFRDARADDPAMGDRRIAGWPGSVDGA